MSFTVAKKSRTLKTAKSGAKAVNGSVQLVADPTGPGVTCIVMGTDAVGDLIDISAVATITATIDDPTLIKLDPPTGVSCHITPLKVGTAKLSVVVTWNNGSIGPFSDTLTCVIAQGPVTGVVITINGVVA